MRRKIFFISAIIVLLFAGCTPKPNLVGRWELKTFKLGSIDVFNSKIFSTLIDDCMKTNTHLFFYPEENNYTFELNVCDVTEVTGNYEYRYEEGICIFTNVKSDNNMYNFPNAVVTDNSFMTITMPIKDMDFYKDLPDFVKDLVDSSSSLYYEFERVMDEK